MDALTDGELLERVRQGNTTAYGLLFQRHKDTALRVARRNTPDRHLAEDAVNDAFTSVLAAIQNGAGPVGIFSPYLLSSVMRSVHRMNGRSMRETPVVDTEVLDTTVPDPAQAVADFDNEAARNAFKNLPPRWREVLWYLEIEELQPRDAAPILGLSPNATVALHRRAKNGLRLGYLQEHVEVHGPEECRKMVSFIPAYVLGTLNKTHASTLEKHLTECEECTSVLLQIRDVGVLRTALLPLLGLVPLSQLYPPPAPPTGTPPPRPYRDALVTSLSLALIAAGLCALIAGLLPPAHTGNTGSPDGHSPSASSPAHVPQGRPPSGELQFEVLHHSGSAATAKVTTRIPDSSDGQIRMEITSAAAITAITPSPDSALTCTLAGSFTATCTQGTRSGASVLSVDMEMNRPACPVPSPVTVTIQSGGNMTARDQWATPCSASGPNG